MIIEISRMALTNNNLKGIINLYSFYIIIIGGFSISDSQDVSIQNFLIKNNSESIFFNYLINIFS